MPKRPAPTVPAASPTSAPAPLVAAAVYLHVSELRPNPRNPRLHGEEAVRLARTTLRIVVEAHHRHAGGLAVARGGRDVGDEVLPMTRVDNVARAREITGATRGAGGGEGVGGGAEDAGGELGAGAGAIVEREGAADGAELVTTEAGDEVGQRRERGEQRVELGILGERIRGEDTELAAQIGEAQLGERRQHRARRRS